jgi:N-acyl-D-aspartate/D-glutamate deacylase
MSSTPDMVIRGGTVVDGSGREPEIADVAIAEGRIVAVGKVSARGREEIDARGLLVTPGFVDIHTHYDAQVTWSHSLSSSCWHGVTTALIGNCGVGFAPCLPERRDMLVKLMEGVEDLPEVVLTEGLPWNWQSFPEFLDALGARRYDTDVATQVPHAAVRVHVMGQRGADREPSTEAERREMARIVAEGIRAGALGFSTSRTIAHKTRKGEHTPTLGAAEGELGAIADALRGVGAGWMQVISDFDDPDEEFAMLRRVAAASGQVMSTQLLQRANRPELWRQILDKIEDANRDGTRILGQVMGRPIGLMLGFELSQHPFVTRPSWRAIADLPFADKLAILRQSEFRTRLLAEPTADPAMARRLNTWENLFPLGDPPRYEPPPESSIAAIAKRQGRDPQDVAYDTMLERDGRGIINYPVINYAHGNLDAVKTMVEHPNTLMGLGDGGAHVGLICDASSTTHMITHWTRDRTRGPRLPLQFAVKRLSRDNALALDLADRGLIAAGHKADINVIDYDRLGVRSPELWYDLPAGGKRLVQRADGYVATIVSGAVVHRNGEPTGALPGRLVRGPRTAA